MTSTNVVDVSRVSGNASADVKAFVSNLGFFTKSPDAPQSTRFSQAIAQRMDVTEVSILKKVEEPQKQEARVVCECIVEEDMLNGGGRIHGGCSATLVDLCTALALVAYNLGVTGKPNFSVSQAINMVYHSPAELGEKLRIVSTTMTVGARAMSARCEIWNATQHRLVASGIHITMIPSAPPAKL
ncbi:hypothetical protein HGRIS_010311 [Hohenbuehelia grisea]|uniref:Thioesterase domain-containing protein n=1 Tax=Hohenbuehelia grisea TaxID=104357 RepID=A0ABR3J3Y9_9AGAR